MSTQTLPRIGLGRTQRVRAAATAPIARFRAHLTVPLHRNGYALVASSMLTSVLGLGFWVVAARAYSPAAVGVSAALIAAMTLLANLSHLNLKGALNRFLPRAGSSTGRFVTRSYLLALGLSALASLIFIAGLDVWSPRLGFVADRPELALWFVAGTMAWTIFVLQDSVLAGIRQAAWVPAENLIFSISKVALLLVVAAAMPTLGVFVSWTAPAVVLIVPVTLLLFRRLIPAHVRETRDREQPAGLRRVARYAAPDYLAYTILAGTIGVLPLIVLGRLGAEANAYYFVSWSVAYALYLISTNMGMALLAEASLDPDRLGEHRRRMIIGSARLVVPAAVVILVAAPAILGVMGKSYSDESITLLRLLAVSAVPFIIVEAHVNTARVKQRMRTVVGTWAALCGLVFAFGLPLLGALGITGLGVAWLAAQSTVAAAITAGHLRGVSRGEWRKRALRTVSTALRRTRHWRRRIGSAPAVDAILQRLRRNLPDASAWVVQRHVETLNEVAVSVIGPRGGPPVALLKRACTPAADRSLQNQERALLALRGDSRLGEWTRIVPDVLASGDFARRRFLVETAVEGVSAERLLEEGADPGKLIAAATAAIEPLHQATREVTPVDEQLLREWVDLPLARLRPVVARRPRPWVAQRALDRLAGQLREALAGRRVVTSRVHGDFSPGNALLSPDGATVRGIVDWERGQAKGISRLDLLQLQISTEMSVQRREMGEVVTDLLDKGPRSQRHLVLLTWLHHIAGNIAKSERYARSRVWVRRNIDPILASVLCQPAPAAATAPATAPAPAVSPPGRRRRWSLRGAWRVAARLRAAVRGVSLELAAPVVGLSLAAILWLVSLGDIDPRAMTDLGLISVLPVIFYAALLLLTASFAALALRRPRRTPLLTAHLLALIAFLHATPAIVYGTLRYSWAWKHAGIVDYIQSHGGVSPDIGYLSVYHNWPGFFGLDSLLTGLAGLSDTIDIAMWAPVFFNVLNLGALVFVFSALTRDRRVIWLGSWLFFIANWVGQDYFSPQAFGFFLYLVILGTVLTWLRGRRGETHTGTEPRRPSPETGPAGGRLRARLDAATAGDRGTRAAATAGDRGTRAAATAFVVLAVAAIVPSHALTSGVVVLALGALVLFGICGVRSLPFVAGGITALWAILFAWDFVTHQGISTLETAGLPWLTAESTLAPVGQLSDGQQLVATVSRGLVVAMVALGMVGALRQLRARRLDRAAVILALVPLLIFAGGNYDGEVLFRIYLFAIPFLAFLAAHALLPRAATSTRSWRPVLVSSVGLTAILAAFLVAYYGKEGQYYFTPSEVAASEYLYTHAPSGALLIEGTPNYPRQFENYERFDYATMSQEPRASQAKLLARPAPVLSQWMSDDHHSGAFLIVTRSQMADVDQEGVMAPGSLRRIERALIESPRFTFVFRNRDATIFRLARDSQGAPR